MPSSIALGCGGYEAHMQQILTPYGVFSRYRGSRFLLTETVRIKQNRAENAKPSQFSRVFLEVPGGLRRDNEIQQALISSQRYSESPEIQFSGLFQCTNLFGTVSALDLFQK